jgi:hypothetical protein
MTSKFNTFITACAFISFSFCLAAGIWILAKVGFDFDSDALSTAIGLYFVGKAFFVGPALLVAACRLEKYPLTIHKN